MYLEKVRERAKTWFDEECRNQLGKRETLRKRMIQLQTNESREKYANCRKEAKKRKYEAQKYEVMEIDPPKPGSRKFYRAVSLDKKGRKIHPNTEGQSRPHDTQ